MCAKIHFTRDSVCMRDDCLDNSRDFQFENSDSWEKIIPVILKNHFLSNVSGNDVIWVLINNIGEEILSYFTYKNKIIKCNTDMCIEESCKGNYTLHFKYYSSPKKEENLYMKLITKANIIFGTMVG